MVRVDQKIRQVWARLDGNDCETQYNKVSTAG